MPQWNRKFRVTRDGQRILGAKSLEDAPDRSDPVVVIHWSDELEAKVPNKEKEHAEKMEKKKKGY